jgi:hypothetical protein
VYDGVALGEPEGAALGLMLGEIDGPVLGEADGAALGVVLGVPEGAALGLVLGEAEGATLGPALGNPDGAELGTPLGDSLGATLGTELGELLGALLGQSVAAQKLSSRGLQGTLKWNKAVFPSLGQLHPEGTVPVKEGTVVNVLSYTNILTVATPLTQVDLYSFVSTLTWLDTSHVHVEVAVVSSYKTAILSTVKPSFQYCSILKETIDPYCSVTTRGISVKNPS